jgi:hypothetical protein
MEDREKEKRIIEVV